MSSTAPGKSSQIAQEYAGYLARCAQTRPEDSRPHMEKPLPRAPSSGFGGQGVGKKHTDKARRYRNLLLGGRSQEAWRETTQESAALTHLATARTGWEGLVPVPPSR